MIDVPASATAPAPSQRVNATPSATHNQASAAAPAGAAHPRHVGRPVAVLDAIAVKAAG